MSISELDFMEGGLAEIVATTSSLEKHHEQTQKKTNPGDWQKEPMMKLPSMGKTENRTGENTSVERPSRRSTIVRLSIRKTNLASWRAIPLEMFLLSAKPRFSW